MKTKKSPPTPTVRYVTSGCCISTDSKLPSPIGWKCTWMHCSSGATTTVSGEFKYSCNLMQSHVMHCWKRLARGSTQMFGCNLCLGHGLQRQWTSHKLRPVSHHCRSEDVSPQSKTGNGIYPYWGVSWNNKANGDPPVATSMITSEA